MCLESIITARRTQSDASCKIPTLGDIFRDTLAPCFSNFMDEKNRYCLIYIQNETFEEFNDVMQDSAISESITPLLQRYFGLVTPKDNLQNSKSFLQKHKYFSKSWTKS